MIFKWISFIRVLSSTIFIKKAWNDQKGRLFHFCNPIFIRKPPNIIYVKNQLSKTAKNPLLQGSEYFNSQTPCIWFIIMNDPYAIKNTLRVDLFNASSKTYLSGQFVNADFFSVDFGLVEKRRFVKFSNLTLGGSSCA